MKNWIFILILGLFFGYVFALALASGLQNLGIR